MQASLRPAAWASGKSIVFYRGVWAWGVVSFWGALVWGFCMFTLESVKGGLLGTCLRGPKSPVGGGSKSSYPREAMEVVLLHLLPLPQNPKAAF